MVSLSFAVQHAIGPRRRAPSPTAHTPYRPYTRLSDTLPPTLTFRHTTSFNVSPSTQSFLRSILSQFSGEILWSLHRIRKSSHTSILPSLDPRTHVTCTFLIFTPPPWPGRPGPCRTGPWPHSAGGTSCTGTPRTCAARGRSGWDSTTSSSGTC